MTITPDWIMAACAIIAVIVSIVALFVANKALTQVNNITGQNSANVPIGAQKIKGNTNKTATGTNNTIS